MNVDVDDVPQFKQKESCFNSTTAGERNSVHILLETLYLQQLFLVLEATSKELSS